MVSLDAERSWFRYHHLFADLLALELRRTAPEELPGLHTIAAEWLAEHGYPVEAIRHAQAAENWGLAARLLADNWFDVGPRRPARHRARAAVQVSRRHAHGRMPSWRCSPRRPAGCWVAA